MTSLLTAFLLFLVLGCMIWYFQFIPDKKYPSLLIYVKITKHLTSYKVKKYNYGSLTLQRVFSAKYAGEETNITVLWGYNTVKDRIFSFELYVTEFEKTDHMGTNTESIFCL